MVGYIWRNYKWRAGGDQMLCSSHNIEWIGREVTDWMTENDSLVRQCIYVRKIKCVVVIKSNSFGEERR